MRLTLAHPEQSPVHHLEGVSFQVDQEKQQPIFWRRQRTVLIGRLPAGGARFPIEAPVGHRSLKHGFKGRNQPLKLLQRQAGQVQHLRGAGLHVGEPSMAHGGSLLSSEAQAIINRDELYRDALPHLPLVLGREGKVYTTVNHKSVAAISHMALSLAARFSSRVANRRNGLHRWTSRSIRLRRW